LWWTKWRWGRFSASTSVSPANLHSTNCSSITLIYHLGTYNRPEVAAVPGDVSPTPLKKKKRCQQPWHAASNNDFLICRTATSTDDETVPLSPLSYLCQGEGASSQGTDTKCVGLGAGGHEKLLPSLFTLRKQPCVCWSPNQSRGVCTKTSQNTERYSLKVPLDLCHSRIRCFYVTLLTNRGWSLRLASLLSDVTSLRIERFKV
jgi:hypothetical protein